MIKSILRNTVDRFPIAAQFYRNFRDQLDQRQPSIRTPWGFTLAGHPAMASGDFEPEETKAVRMLLDEVDLLVNVGSNIGYYCCHALSLGKSVIAIEPNARNLFYLLKNLQNNGWAKQAQIFPVALGAGTDIMQMWGGGTGASLVKGWASIPESYVTHVPVLSMDHVLGDSLKGKQALVLVDIEGAEYMMLQGATKILRNSPKPIWMMEISATEHQPEGTEMNPFFSQTFNCFYSEGYRSYAADSQFNEIGPETIRNVLSGRQKINTHNFIFRA